MIENKWKKRILADLLICWGMIEKTEEVEKVKEIVLKLHESQRDGERELFKSIPDRKVSMRKAMGLVALYHFVRITEIVAELGRGDEVRLIAHHINYALKALIGSEQLRNSE